MCKSFYKKECEHKYFYTFLLTKKAIDSKDKEKIEKQIKETETLLQESKPHEFTNSSDVVDQ